MSQSTILVTGGAGFLGSNLARRLLDDRVRVRILDDLSGAGAEDNVAWLRRAAPDRLLDVVVADVRDAKAVEQAVREVDHVVHFTPHAWIVLEAARMQRRPPSVVVASTHDVYGTLGDLRLEPTPTRYQPVEASFITYGVGEDRPLEHGPQAAAEALVLEHARMYGLSATILRMSSVYGPRQVDGPLLAALRGQPVIVSGDGRQVRDVLFVDDLIDAIRLVCRSELGAGGHVFNVGGGPERTISVVEMLEQVEPLVGRRPVVQLEPWRPVDARWYVSDARALGRAVGWEASVGVDEGLARVREWLSRKE